MAQVKSFPPIPGEAAKLLGLLRDPEASVSQVEAVLRNDPGLTANVLKLTNSAYFGLSAKIGSVRQAVVLLGSRRLLPLVLASCTHAVLNKDVRGYELSPGELWRHSIAVSVAAEILVRELKLPDADIVFTAALLHDVGKLVLGEFVEDELAKIDRAAAEGIPFEEAEQAVLGTNHAEVGARILRQWSLPEEIVAAARWHHAPETDCRRNPAVDVVHVADVLCLMIGIGVGREGLQYHFSATATERLGLKPFVLEKAASQTLQAVNELSELFGSGQASRGCKHVH